MDAQSQLQSEVGRLVREYGRNRTALMPILQDLNRTHSYISEDAMLCVAKELDVPRTEVYGVATFYSFFSVKPRGKYVIRTCRTISCAKQGHYHSVLVALLQELGIKFGETTADGLFTLEQTNCNGMCDQGPAMLVNDDVHVKLTETSVREILNLYRHKASEQGTTV
ncbi:MAG TPA: NAD(P)H-dependent oxidoreductase subunit E [Rhizomicrobium sp.]